MDVQRPTRERVFSILNDNSCPSFTFKQRQASPALHTQRLPSFSSITAGLSPRLERPSLSRQQPFNRKSSVSSAGSPPLLRYDSASSSKSNSSMDSTPSPITPAYNYNDSNLVQYDPVLRPDLNTNAYLPSPTGITPFMDTGMMIAPAPDPFTGMPKAMPPMNTNPAAYQLPTPIIPQEIPQMPTPALSANVSVSSASTAPPPAAANSTNNNANPTGKKNKYPCPYASSHNCTATFTTSGHAARHGKKHTGEKGVHCPVCDKAFTRKDNMKQHERTHKNRENNKGEDKKSKAQLTREANKVKEAEKQTEQESQLVMQDLPELQHPARMRKSSSGQSDPSDITLAPPLVDTPTMNEGMFDTNPQIAIAPDTAGLDMSLPSPYPPLSDEVMLAGGLMHDNKASSLMVPQAPALIRGFSDLDTLAQAAESAFDPYFQQNSF